MDGILIIDKPAGITSHDVVDQVRKITGIQRVGHTGTLDPFATGVLVIMIGKGTRLSQFLDRSDKEYESIARFGYETDTGDLTGNRRYNPNPNQDLEQVIVAGLNKAMQQFRGDIEQLPPMYSAKKVKGKKLYELARKGIEIERKPVPVTISTLEVASNKAVKPKSDVPALDIKIRVVCSAGTYIRVLVEDLGKALGVGGHLAALRRTRAGVHNIDKAITLEKLKELFDAGRMSEALIPMSEAVAHLPIHVLSAEEIKLVTHGGRISFSAELPDQAHVRMCDETDHLYSVGTYHQEAGFLHPGSVFLTAE